MSELLLNPNFGVVLIGAFVAGMAGLAWAVGSSAIEQNYYRKTLRSIDDIYEFTSIRDQELMLPFADRVMEPVNGLLLGLSRRFSPKDYLQGVRMKMLRAGELDPRAGDKFLVTRAACALGAPILFFVLLATKPIGDGMVAFFVAAVGAFVVFSAPDASLNRKVEAREKAIRLQLPDILDLLVICVEAGLGFNAALSRTIQSVGEGELSNEFALALGEMKAGATRGETLTNLGERIRIDEIQNFVTAMRQADKFGTSIGNTLREQASVVRIARRQAAQEAAQKAPVKMLVPMVFFIFPPMFLIILGPAGISLTSGGL